MSNVQSTDSPVGMRWIEGGRFLMGSDRFYPEESPERVVQVDGFWVDEVPVTNAMFGDFVRETGYVTFAERAPSAQDYPDADPEQLRAGSMLFVPPDAPVALGNIGQWWAWSIGTDWRHPQGPASSLAGLEDHPVVHVAHCDAQAFAAWAGKALPTEAEWECAARGGLAGADYAWGAEFEPDGRPMANYWQGEFPWLNALTDGYLRTSPVRSFPANGFGLFDMIGNVWEWTDDWYVPASHLAQRKSVCGCAPRNPRGGDEADSLPLGGAAGAVGRRVLKGGSHLCAANYCQRYRPAARHPQAIDTTTSHIGFRCVYRPVRG